MSSGQDFRQVGAVAGAGSGLRRGRCLCALLSVVVTLAPGIHGVGSRANITAPTPGLRKTLRTPQHPLAAGLLADFGQGWEGVVWLE